MEDTMENAAEGAKAPERIISSFIVVLDESSWVHLFHVNNEYEDTEDEENDDVAQPAGWKLPGGRFEKPRDKTPKHTAFNETYLELGITARLGKYFRNRNSYYGEALREYKTGKNKKGQFFHLTVYTFLGKVTGTTVVGTAEKNEGGAKGTFSLARILLMPLARNIETGEKNFYGIQRSARSRIFIALRRTGYDFRELIPNLSRLMDEINWEEVGDEIYYMLKDALDAPVSETREAESAPDYSEDVEPEVSEKIKDNEYIAEWRRWAKKYEKFFISVFKGEIKVSLAK